MKRSDFSHYRGVFIASGEERKRKRNRTRERIVLRMTGLVPVPVPYMTLSDMSPSFHAQNSTGSYFCFGVAQNATKTQTYLVYKINTYKLF